VKWLTYVFLFASVKEKLEKVADDSFPGLSREKELSATFLFFPILTPKRNTQVGIFHFIVIGSL